MSFLSGESGTGISLTLSMIEDVFVQKPWGSDGKESACNAEDPGWIPGLRRSSGGGSGYTLQYSGLENFTDRGAWWAPVQGVARSQTQSEQHLGDVSEVLGCLKVGPGGVETAALGGMPHPCSVPVSMRSSTVPWFPSNPVQFWKRKLIYVELIYPCTTSGWIIY